ncbi:(Fe-S)-binding protein [Desulfurivibrio sp. D14AmB]|uniref:(Fe-S)-binding protein n=1 Tax=Desulfurivibrio sp. D14AmB TaxID=3374370 RepID=UPI00376F3BAF
MKKRSQPAAKPGETPTCAKCGACSTVCPVYRVTGREYHTGRGKLHLLEKLDPAAASAAYAEILSRCLLCGACSAVCSRKIPVAAQLAAARAELNRRAGEQALKRHLVGDLLARPRLLELLAPLARRFNPAPIPADSGLNLRLGLPPQLPAEAEKPPKPATAPPTTTPYLFAGCYGTYLAPAIGHAVQSLLGKAGVEAPQRAAGWGCCGLAAYGAGRLDQARGLARRNIAAHPGPASIVVSCASCAAHLSHYPQLLADDEQWRPRAEEFAGRIKEFSLFLQETTSDQPLPPTPGPGPEPGPRLKILYHDPCHLRFMLPITKPPRKLLSALPQTELVELPRGPRCCGHGGLFNLAHPTDAAAILAELAAECRQSGAEIVTSTCTGCLLHWQKAATQQLIPARVLHLAILLDRLTSSAGS